MLWFSAAQAVVDSTVALLHNDNYKSNAIDDGDLVDIFFFFIFIDGYCLHIAVLR